MTNGSDAVPDAAWFKSSYSGGNETECIECAHTGSCTLVRDSKQPAGPVVRICPDAWRAFVGALEQEEPGR